jgi:hypothetical protein
VVVWIDRGRTQLETRAAMVAISSGRHFDELEELRRQNLRAVDRP